MAKNGRVKESLNKMKGKVEMRSVEMRKVFEKNFEFWRGTGAGQLVKMGQVQVGDTGRNEVLLLDETGTNVNEIMHVKKRGKWKN